MMPVPCLLAIDDDPGVLQCFQVVFRELGMKLDTAQNGRDGLEKFLRNRPDVVLLDVDLPDLSGLETYRRLREVDPRVPIIFITGSNSTDTAIEAMSLGAFDYVLKPVGMDDLNKLVTRAIEVSRLMRPAVVNPVSAGNDGPDALVGRCAAMQAVYKAIGRVAPQDVTVLILGESGTGKELAARAIYNYSRRSTGPFLAVNCAAIPESLLESELFGHEKGAFTGAVQRRIGKFEQCSGGTLFLDEVGDMTPLTQTKVLRVLQDQTFERVGGNETIRTNVRIIAATNRNLERMVAAGQFRGDLYYRLNVFSIRLPPLRERGDDLPVLVDFFLRRFGAEFAKEIHGLADETLALFRRYPWPGNLRELQSVLKHSLLEATGPVIVPEFLPEPLRNLGATSGTDCAPIATPEEWDRFVEERLQAGTQDLYHEWQALTEKRLFATVLRQSGGNLSKAARALGIHRATLRAKLDALGLEADGA